MAVTGFVPLSAGSPTQCIYQLSYLPTFDVQLKNSTTPMHLGYSPISAHALDSQPCPIWTIGHRFCFMSSTVIFFGVQWAQTCLVKRTHCSRPPDWQLFICSQVCIRLNRCSWIPFYVDHIQEARRNRHTALAFWITLPVSLDHTAFVFRYNGFHFELTFESLRWYIS